MTSPTSTIPDGCAPSVLCQRLTAPLGSLAEHPVDAAAVLAACREASPAIGETSAPAPVETEGSEHRNGALSDDDRTQIDGVEHRAGGDRGACFDGDIRDDTGGTVGCRLGCCAHSVIVLRLTAYPTLPCSIKEYDESCPAEDRGFVGGTEDRHDGPSTRGHRSPAVGDGREDHRTAQATARPSGDVLAVCRVRQVMTTSSIPAEGTLREVRSTRLR